MYKLRSTLSLVFFLSLVACSGNAPNTVAIGPTAISLESDFATAKNIKLRTFDFESNGNVLKKTIDLTDLLLQVQSQGAIRDKVLLAVRSCYSPSVRHGVPTVQCRGLDEETIILSGDDDIRSSLLHMDGKIGYVVGEVIGIYGNIALTFKVI
jgi:hypothetical protein